MCASAFSHSPGDGPPACAGCRLPAALRPKFNQAKALLGVRRVLSLLAAYGLTVLQAPGARWVFPVFLAGIMIPLEGIIVPLYYTMRDAGLTSSLTGLALAHAGLGLSFGVFWMRATLLAVPRELIESAQLDGAGRVQLA